MTAGVISWARVRVGPVVSGESIGWAVYLDNRCVLLTARREIALRYRDSLVGQDAADVNG